VATVARALCLVYNTDDMQRRGRRFTGSFVVTLLAIGGAALSWRLAYVLATRGDLVGGDGFHYGR